MKAKSISLFFKEGSSDKVYQADLEQQDGGWVVNFAYGRRGSSLTTGSKTPGPLSYDEAEHIFNKLVTEKTKKGYTPDPNGKVFQGVIGSTNEFTGVIPQLLNPIDEGMLDHYLNDNYHLAQEKFDGRRRLLFCEGPGSYGANRKGLKVDISDAVLSVIQNYPHGTILDGEDLGDKIVIFDIASLKTDALDRYMSLMEMWVPSGGVLELADTALLPEAKRAMYEDLKARKGEGIVFKDKASKYHPGRPASGGSQLKYKFVESASVIVTFINQKTRSVRIAVRDNLRQVEVGNVTIYPNFPVPNVGDIIEVQYLYFFPGGSLYQPVYLGVRDDLVAADCTLAKLKTKQTTIIDEA